MKYLLTDNRLGLCYFGTVSRYMLMNDRLACTTAWIASPAETVALLDEISQLSTAPESLARDANFEDQRKI